MNRSISLAAGGLILTLLGSVPVPAVAATASRLGDTEMSCSAVFAERTAIEDGVAKRAEARDRSAKRNAQMFGFAKGLAGAVAPMALSSMGLPGGMAAQLATQAAYSAAGRLGAEGAVAPSSISAATGEEAARLSRLDALSTARRCSSEVGAANGL